MRLTDNAKSTATHSRKSAGSAPVCAWVLSVVASAFMFASDVGAQIVQIDPATTQSVTLSGTQQDEINRFLTQYADDAFSDDRRVAARSLEDLIDPLLGEGVSVVFRQAYADRLSDKIIDVLGDSRILLDDGTINHKPYHALRLAGEIATDRTLAAIIETLDSEDPGRRYFAIHCIETALFRMRTSAPAITARTLLNRRQEGTASGLLPQLGKMLAAEKSGRHASAIVGTLAEAAELPDDVVEGASDEAITLIGNGSAARVRASADGEPAFEDILSWLTAGQRIVRVIAQPGSSNGPTSLSAIRLGGQLIAAVYRDVEAGRVIDAANRKDNPDARVHMQMLGIAENLLLFGEQNAAAAAGRRQNADLIAATNSLSEAFTKGDDNGLKRTALGLISPNGLLTAAPYGFTDDEFIVE